MKPLKNENQSGSRFRARLQALAGGWGISRRDVFRAGGATVAAGLLGRTPAVAAAAAEPPSAGENLYTRIGVRPYINLTAAYTIHGGLQSMPSVKRAMEEASHYSVNIDELMEKVGERVARLLGSEAAMVTCGCASALCHATAACVTGGDPEKIAQLPSLAGLKNEVIMPLQSRNVYDFAIRSLGVKMVNVETREQLFAALSDRTVMLAKTEAERGPIRLEDLVEAGRKVGAPVLVDAAAIYPVVPNPYLARGADLVAYSGGKVVRGPQCAGTLLGRKDLIRAAWISSAPHHGFGRMMKVGKEEIMGMLAAIETLVHERTYEADRREWDAALTHIGEKLSQIPGVRAKLMPPPSGNPHPPLQVDWDPEQIGMTAGELHRILLEAEPRLMTLAEGDGHSFVVRAAGMQPGDEKPAAERLSQVFREALKKGKRQPAPPVVNIAGQWAIDVQYAAVPARHAFLLEVSGSRVTGEHSGRSLKGKLQGTIDGDRIHLISVLRDVGFSASYTFDGRLTGGRMSGEVDLGEYGRARWTATRLS